MRLFEENTSIITVIPCLLKRYREFKRALVKYKVEHFVVVEVVTGGTDNDPFKNGIRYPGTDRNTSS